MNFSESGDDIYEELKSKYKDFDNTLLQWSEFGLYCTSIICLILAIVGVVLNGVLLLIFIRHHEMRNTANLYITSVTVADIINIISPFLETTKGDVIHTGHLVKCHYQCKISCSLTFITTVASAFSLAALSADRYFVITNPFNYRSTAGRSPRSPKIPMISVVFIWIVSISASVPTMLSSFAITIKHTDEICICMKDEWHYWQFEILIAISFLMLFIFNGLLARYLFQKSKNVPGESMGTAKLAEERRKTVKTVLILVFIFAVCFTPNIVKRIMFKLYEREHGTLITLNLLGNILLYSHFCVHPMALYCMGEKYKKYFKKYLGCKSMDGTENTN